MPPVVVASFNAHAGVDGWGRPFDVVAACQALDADVLVLAEAWLPRHGTGTADEVATALGYQVHRFPMAPARLLPPLADADARWGPRRLPRRRRALRTEAATGGPPLSRRADRATPGTVELALLTRVPLLDVGTVDLGRLPGDRCRRGAIVAEVDTGAAGPIFVAGTHMSHLRHGSPVQLRRLRRALAGRQVPGALIGDFNLWGPPLVAVLRGWRRAVRGRTWPAWRPLAQIDHVLVTGPLVVGSAAVVRAGNSDHLPVRVTLSVSCET